MGALLCQIVDERNETGVALMESLRVSRCFLREDPSSGEVSEDEQWLSDNVLEFKVLD